jgi:cAMP phosphodiesterase
MPGCFMTAFLVDEKLLVDAGTIGQVLDLKEQMGIRDVLVSHSHLDHCGALANFAVNIFSNDAPPVRVHAIQPTLDAVQSHILNNQIWPDFTKIKKMNGSTVLELAVMQEGKASTVSGYQVTPVKVNHPVPCTGFVISDAQGSLVYTADTAVTDAIWEAANAAPKLKGLITEVSFPNSMQKLAEVSGHLTPSDLKKELAKVKLAKDIKLFIYHMKPEFDDQIRKEVAELGMPNIQVLKTGQTFVL